MRNSFFRFNYKTCMNLTAALRGALRRFPGGDTPEQRQRRSCSPPDLHCACGMPRGQTPTSTLEVNSGLESSVSLYSMMCLFSPFRPVTPVRNTIPPSAGTPEWSRSSSSWLMKCTDAHVVIGEIVRHRDDGFLNGSLVRTLFGNDKALSGVLLARRQLRVLAAAHAFKRALHRDSILAGILFTPGMRRIASE